MQLPSIHIAAALRELGATGRQIIAPTNIGRALAAILGTARR